MHVFIKNRYEKWKEPLDDSLTGEKKNVGFSTNGETWFVPGASSNATAQGKRKFGDHSRLAASSGVASSVSYPPFGRTQ